MSLLAETTAATTADLEAFRFAEATRRLRDFTWNDFCDWYVEFVKGRLRDPSARPLPSACWRRCSTASAGCSIRSCRS